jgi:hypothetical protein
VAYHVNKIANNVIIATLYIYIIENTILCALVPLLEEEAEGFRGLGV